MQRPQVGVRSGVKPCTTWRQRSASTRAEAPALAPKFLHKPWVVVGVELGSETSGLSVLEAADESWLADFYSTCRVQYAFSKCMRSFSSLWIMAKDTVRRTLTARALSVLLLALTFHVTAGAQVMSPSEIEATIKDLAEPLVAKTRGSPQMVPGLVVGFTTEAGSGVLGFGTTRLRGGDEPGGGTFFGIGSITKIFTGIILAKAVVDGDVQLDDSVNNYLKGDLRLDPSISAQDLVTHSAGLPDFPANLAEFRDFDNDGRNDSVRDNPGRNYTRAQMAACLRGDCGRGGAVGAQSKYSNLGFGLLGIALQDRLGFADFDSMNREYITKPLGMHNTGLKSRRMRQKVFSRAAIGYDGSGGNLRPVPFPEMGALASAGGLITTADDMILLLRALTGLDKTKLSSALTKAIQPLNRMGKDEIAYGIKVSRSASGATLYSKGGATAGFSSFIVWSRTPKVGFILMANRGRFGKLQKVGLDLANRATSPGASARSSDIVSVIEFD